MNPTSRKMKICIVGGGAAGCFAAINIKELAPDADVSVFEAGKKILAKVAITGGGRCNLTNSFADVRSIESVYPRGHRLMRHLLKEFSNVDVFEWFEKRGVRLVTQPDNCVFPKSQDAMEIVHLLENQMRRLGVKTFVEHKVSRIESIPQDGGAEFKISFAQREQSRELLPETADVVLVTTGGSPKSGGLSMLEPLALDMENPVPSLFSFNIGAEKEQVLGGKQDVIQGTDNSRNAELSSLMGTVVTNVVAGIAGTKFRASGPLLITDWGMSGPAILKLSSYSARFLAEKEYKANLSVNWLGDEMNTDDAVSMLKDFASNNPQKQLSSVFPEAFNSRLWSFLLHRAGLSDTRRWAELGGKGMSRLAAVLTSDIYPVTGRNKFKGEFVTCGGVALSNVNSKTLECRKWPGLYFAGEVLDVDAITGGFNLQAAWTMGYVAARAIASAPEP